ncbi:MAG: DUF4177 domain-containing protein [Paracoccaceae bacterium]|nr:DUF4177 domain-containing protein [Paracoccaceae bacterium]
MTRYEYKVLPAPQRGVKAKGAKSTEARFAHALMEIMNELGRDGWEYQRTDTLPCEERVGLTGRATRFQNMLVFRRALVPHFRTTVVPEFVHAPPAADASNQGPGETADGLARVTPTRPLAPPSVTRRLAAALSVRASEGKSPEVRAVEPATGPAPRLNATRGNGPSQPDDPKGDGPGVAAE